MFLSFKVRRREFANLALPVCTKKPGTIGAEAWFHTLQDRVFPGVKIGCLSLLSSTYVAVPLP
jgi:hypothetical protein